MTGMGVIITAYNSSPFGAKKNVAMCGTQTQKEFQDVYFPGRKRDGGSRCGVLRGGGVKIGEGSGSYCGGDAI